MEVHTMRYWLRQVYPGQAWNDRVKNMSDNQVIAIYSRMLAQGKIKGAAR